MLVETELGIDAISYIRRALSRGKELAQGLLHLPLETGRVRAFLPESASEQAKTAFGQGGIIARSSIRFPVPGGTAEPVDRHEGDLALAMFITSYLAGADDHYIVFESLFSREDSPAFVITKARTFRHDNDLYVFAGHEDCSVESALRVIRASRGYPVIGALAAAPAGDIEEGKVVSADTLERLARRADHIVVGAYDAEAELIWSRR